MNAVICYDQIPSPESVAHLSAAYRAGALSPEDVTERDLARIAAIDPVLHAFQHVDAAGARSAAAASAVRWRAGQPLGQLDGVPLTIQRQHGYGRPADPARVHHDRSRSRRRRMRPRWRGCGRQGR